MNKEVGQFLANQLYPDLKSWIVSLGRKLRNPIARARAETFESPKTLLGALKTGQVRDGDLITLECKPAQFGPFLRNHFLSPFVGRRTDMRLGPPLSHENPILGIMAQTTSHLQPVGLYPPVRDGVHQACLYPSDAKACGFLGLMPGLNGLVEYIPSLLASRHIPYCGTPCNLTGVVRLVDAQVMTEFGVSPEDYEETRQSGNIWFIDATADESECVPLDDALTTELWGGLYASGHLEIANGSVQYDQLVDSFVDAFKNQNFDPEVTQNRAGRQEIMIYAKGIRALLDTKAPVYSIHMDAELAITFGKYRNKFDSICSDFVDNINTICKEESVDLKNEMDLDFSYTDASDAFTVLQLCT